MRGDNLRVCTFLIALLYAGYLYIVINKILGLEKRIFKGIGDMSPLVILFLIPGYLIADSTKEYYIEASVIITIVFVVLVILINRVKKKKKYIR